MIAPLLISDLTISFISLRELAIVLGLDRKTYLAVLALMVWGIAMIATSSPDKLSLGLEA